MSRNTLEYLNTIECHFKWRPEKDDGMVDNIPLLEKKLLHDINDNENIEIFALTLLIYIFTEGDGKGKGTDFQKAKRYAQQARKQSKTNGEKVVTIANTMHLLKKCQKLEELENLYIELKHYQDTLTVHDQCTIKLIHAFALSRFGLTAYKKALNIHESVIENEEKNPDAHFGLGVMIGRIRRYTHGNVSKPQELELKTLQKACELWNNSNAHSVVWYGYAKTQALLYDHKKEERRICEEELQEVSAILDNAKRLADNRPGCSCIIYKWCAKGFKYLGHIRSL